MIALYRTPPAGDRRRLRNDGMLPTETGCRDMYSWKDALAHIPHSYDRLFPSRYVFDPETIRTVQISRIRASRCAWTANRD